MDAARTLMRCACVEARERAGAAAMRQSAARAGDRAGPRQPAVDQDPGPRAREDPACQPGRARHALLEGGVDGRRGSADEGQGRPRAALSTAHRQLSWYAQVSTVPLY